MDEPVVFRESLHLRRGPLGLALLAAAVAAVVVGVVLVPWGVVLAVVGAALFATTWFGGTETVVTTSAILHRVRPLRRVRRVALADVVEAEIVVADGQTSLFGGWRGSRGGLPGALVESVEGPRQVGNRAVRVQLRSGGVVQVATWKPVTLLAAIRGADPTA